MAVYHVCDRCGHETAPGKEEKPVNRISTQFTLNENQRDLCGGCSDVLTKIVEDFFKEAPNDQAR